MERLEAVLLREVGVPRPHHRSLREFAHQEAVHPPESELNIQQAFLCNVPMKLGCV